MPQLTRLPEQIMRAGGNPLDPRLTCYFPNCKSTKYEQGADW